MKLLSTLFLVFIFIVQPAISQDADADVRTLKILTFNILHGATTNGDFDLDAIAKVIISADPDLVALQEVDYKTNRALISTHSKCTITIQSWQ
jgi:hypothetical protein